MELFKGRHKKLKYTAAIIFLVFGCIATLGALTYASMTSTAQYQVNNLRVEQKDTALVVTWDETDAAGYELFLQRNGERPRVYTAEENNCSIEPEVLDQEYRVTVTAVNAFGGLSAAKSQNIQTKKLDQTIETEEEKFVGIEEHSRAMEAQAHGEMTYSSSDPSIVEVSAKGVMKYMSEGRAEITVKVAEGNQYKAAKKTVPITVYPDQLDTPQLKLDSKTDVIATLSWEPVEYARGYILKKYDPAKKKYVKFQKYGKDTVSADVVRDQAKYQLMATAKVEGDQIESDPSKTVKVKSTAESAESYGSSHNLLTLDHSTLEMVASISGSGGASVPQSMSHVGDNYVVTFVDHGGSTGVFAVYDKDGNRLDTVGISGMGHANGSTYNPNTNRIYTVKTHRQIRSAECSAYNPETGERESVFTLPRVTSGIAYDSTTNKYCLSKGNEIYLTDDEFNVEEFIWKRIRYNHAQDIGAYNGVAMVCTWVAGNESYIDLYRTTDGAYLGSYNVPIGEIESCFVDDKHLIILMNNATGGWGDCIVRTAEPIALP